MKTQRSSTILFVLSLAATLSGCGDDTAGPSDASTDATTTDSATDAARPDASLDGAGPEMCVVTIDYDTDNDSVTDRVRIDHVDMNGLLQLQELDLELGGDYEEVSTYTYDGDGRVHVIASDFDGDGIPNSWRRFSYDDDGNRTKLEFGSGETSTAPTLAYDSTYDEQGNLIREETDQDADGEIDEVTVHENTYDGDQLTSTRVDELNDGAFDREIAYEYDAAGRVTKTTTTVLAGPSTGDVFISVLAYDGMGRKVRLSLDSDGDGTNEEERVFTYEGSFLTRVEYQLVGGGAPTLRELRTLEYAGTCSANYDPLF